MNLVPLAGKGQCGEFNHLNDELSRTAVIEGKRLFSKHVPPNHDVLADHQARRLMHAYAISFETARTIAHLAFAVAR